MQLPVRRTLFRNGEVTWQMTVTSSFHVKCTAPNMLLFGQEALVHHELKNRLRS